MQKTHKVIQTDLEKTIMDQVKTEKIVMKPRWYFIAGSVLTFIGLTAASVGAVFLTNMMLFLLRRHGQGGSLRLQQMLGSFPWWIPVLAIVGIVFGIWMLKKYDFSYKKNFWFISIGFVAAVILSAFIIDKLGLNEVWSRQGPMRRFYQQVEGQSVVFQKGGGGMSNRKRFRLN